MEKILYIGNKLEVHGKAPTSADILPKLFEKENVLTRVCSSKKNKILRIIDFTWHILKYGPKVRYVLIDTYSTLNFWYALWCGLMCRLIGTKYIPLLRGGNLEKRLANNNLLANYLFRNAMVNVAPSKFLKKIFEQNKLYNVVYIPNSIVLSNYDHFKRLNIVPKLLWVRAFAEVYNPEMAIQVIKELLKKHPEAELCMVGPDKDGSLLKLKRKVKRENLPVKFSGKLSKEEWVKLSEEYDIFINTTNVDNTPVSVMEAMALGLPVVSTDVGGIPYLIEDGNEGLLVKENDYIGMANCIENLIDDQELTDKISSNARRKVEKFDWDHVKSHWLELLG